MTVVYDFFFFFQAEDGIRDVAVTGVQTCALPIWRPVLFVPTRRNRRETVSRKRIHASFERSRRLPGQSLAQRRRAEDGRLRRRPEPHSWYESLQKGDAKDPGGSSATQDPARHPRPAKGLVLASSRESLLWRHLRWFRRGKSHGAQASRPARSRRRTRRND